MTCVDCTSFLQRRLDGEYVEADSVVERHLQLCAQCRDLENGLRLLTHVQPAVPPVNRELTRVIVERILADCVPARREHLRARRVSALAASMLILVLGGLAMLPPSGQDVSPIVVARNEPPLSLRAEQLTVDLATLWNRTAAETALDRLVVLPTPTWTAEPELVLFDDSARALRETGQGLSTGLQPVTDSALRAWNLFTREMMWVE